MLIYHQWVRRLTFDSEKLWQWVEPKKGQTGVKLPAGETAELNTRIELYLERLSIFRLLTFLASSLAASGTSTSLQQPGRDGDGADNWKPSWPEPSCCQRSALPRHKRYSGSAAAQHQTGSHTCKSSSHSNQGAVLPVLKNGRSHSVIFGSFTKAAQALKIVLVLLLNAGRGYKNSSDM